MAQLEEMVLPLEVFVDLDRGGPVPLYHQIAQRLESAIRDDVLPAGSRLENEVALASRLRLSRPTIRRAIQELVDKGLLVRRRGIGTQVVHGKVARNVELTSLHDDLRRSGQDSTTTLISSEKRAADSHEAELLGVEPSSPVLHIQRLRRADGVPLAILDNVSPEDFIDLTTDDLEHYGLYQVLRAKGVAIRVAKQSIGARAATAGESELLGIAKNVPVLTMMRTAFDNSGRAIELGRHCYRPD